MKIQGLTEQIEQYMIQVEAYLTKAVEEMINQELPVLTAKKFGLFQTTGNRLIYEKDYFAKRKFLTVFGVAARWLKYGGFMQLGKVPREAILKKLEEILLSVCVEECWALPAHVNPQDVNWRHTIDLFAAETAQTLSSIAGVLKNDLSSQCLECVKEQVQVRVLQPFYESAPGTYNWEQCDNNWNAVCNGNIGSAYLHSLEDGEELNYRYIDRICNNMLYYIQGFAEDGTCMEGLGYYFYGMTYMVNFAEELYQKTQGAIDLLCGDWGQFKAGETDKRAHIVGWWSKCFFASGRTVSFSDGDSRDKYRMGFACALAKRYAQVDIPESKYAMMLEEDACYRYLSFAMDFFCTMQYLEDLNRQQTEATKQTMQSQTTILKDAQWCIAQTTSGMVGFACKGGHNHEPHNHNDVGSFLYVAGTEMFLADLGAGEYTKEYFGEGRYQILCNRSLGHNVPVIGEQEQSAGADYKCSCFEVFEKEQQVSVKMELTDAYPVDSLKSFRRTYSFQKDTGTLLLEDEFECTEETRITENLVTQHKPQMKEDGILLVGEGTGCHIRILGKDMNQTLRVVPMKHSNHQGIAEEVYLIQWDSLVNGYHRESFLIEMQ